MQDRLREQWRSRIGWENAPTAAVIDAQSNRSSPQGGESGFDAGKKVKGRKRNLVVDTMGLVIAVTVTAASVQDRDAAAAVVAQACAKAPGLQKLYTDGAYAGACARDIEQRHHIRVEVVRRPGNGTTGTLHNAAQGPAPAGEVNKGFVALPKRWVTELADSNEIVNLFGEVNLSANHLAVRDRLVTLLLDKNQDVALRELLG